MTLTGWLATISQARDDIEYSTLELDGDALALIDDNEEVHALWFPSSAFSEDDARIALKNTGLKASLEEMFREDTNSANVKQELETRELHDVEIMRAGTWNGLEWTEQHIDEAIRNFQQGVVAVPIKITNDGHHGGQPLTMPGGAALGWIKALRRMGEKLIADIERVPRKIAELIEAGAFAKKSIEGWRDYETADGKTWGRVIDGLLFSGIGVPAVYGLSDLVTLYTSEAVPEGRFACSSSGTGSTAPEGRIEDPADAGSGEAGNADNSSAGEADSRTKGDTTVPTGIEIPRERYEQLIGFEKEVGYVKDARVELEKELENAKSKLAETEKANADQKVKLEAYQVKEKETERGAIVATVEKLVTEGRVEPARKDAEVEYLAGMSIEDREKRIKMLSEVTALFDEKTKATAPDDKPTGSISQQIHAKAVALQKKDPALTYEAASKVAIAEMEGKDG